MFRNGELPDLVTNLNCLIKDGGMGDYVCACIAIDYIKKNYPWINLLIWMPDYFVPVAKHLLPPKSVIRGHSLAHKKYNNKLQAISSAWTTHHTSLATHPVDYMFHMLVDKTVEMCDKNYLQIQPDRINYNLPDVPYVVIPVGSTSKVKELSGEVINEIATYIKGKGYLPVFVGKKLNETGTEFKHVATMSDFNPELGLDLIDKTTLLEAAKLMYYAKAVVGMEGGMMHLAACCGDVPLVAGYTFVDPALVMPIRNNVLGNNVFPVTQPESLECRYCQSRMNFMYEHDFRNCFYEDFQCVKNLTADLFIAELEKIL
jgi:ADP-heptose:LPS heptosyltransferase